LSIIPCPSVFGKRFARITKNIPLAPPAGKEPFSTNPNPFRFRFPKRGGGRNAFGKRVPPPKKPLPRKEPSPKPERGFRGFR